MQEHNLISCRLPRCVGRGWTDVEEFEADELFTCWTCRAKAATDKACGDSAREQEIGEALTQLGELAIKRRFMTECCDHGVRSAVGMSRLFGKSGLVPQPNVLIEADHRECAVTTEELAKRLLDELEDEKFIVEPRPSAKKSKKVARKDDGTAAQQATKVYAP